MAAVGEVDIAVGADTGSETARVHLALEGGRSIRGTESDGAGLQVARIGWFCPYGRVRRYGVDAPGVGRRGCSDIAGEVFSPDAEGVAAVGEVDIAVGADAGGETPRVDFAFEGSSGIGGTKGDGAGLQVARIGWFCPNGCVGRYGIDTPSVGRRAGSEVPRRVFSPDVEGMAAVNQVGVAVRVDTSSKTARVYLALEGSRGIGGTKCDSAGLQIARIGRFCSNGHIRCHSVDAPGVGRWSRSEVSSRIFCPDAEGVATVGEVGVAVGTDTGCKAPRIHLALEGGRGIGGTKGDGAGLQVTRIGRFRA